MDKRGMHRPQKRLGLERGRIKEHDKQNNDDDNQVKETHNNYSEQYYVLSKTEKERLRFINEENERLKLRRRNIGETERRVVIEDKRKNVLSSIKSIDNSVKKPDYSRVKESVEDKFVKEKVNTFKKEDIAHEEKIKEVEIIEKDNEIINTPETKSIITSITKDEINEDGEKVSETNFEKEIVQNNTKKLEQQEHDSSKSDHTLSKAVSDTETDTIDVNVHKQKVNNTQTILASTTQIDNNVQTTETTFSVVATEFISTQKEEKDTNNNQQQKEKRKPDREDQHQRKRAKTKIIRKTKLERQVSSDNYVLGLYELGRKLGDGNFAVVRQSRKKETGQEYAVKVIEKAKLKGKTHMVENEIDILKDCCHHNIVRLYEEYETPDRIYLVMELIKGGDLFDAITQKVKFREIDSALMIRDVCSALFYMHSRSIVHRDLKPENLLVHRNKDGAITLKLADFGLAMEVKDPIYTVCGTPTYVAPEILSDIGYGLEVDMWALGVITYILLCGFPPFRSPDRNQTELFDFIKAGHYEFLSPYWDNISRNAKDLISHLLVVDRKKRYTSVDVLCHKWVLCSGQTDVVPDGAITLDGAANQTRRELDGQAKLNYESYQRLKERKKHEGREE